MYNQYAKNPGKTRAQMRHRRVKSSTHKPKAGYVDHGLVPPYEAFFNDLREHNSPQTGLSIVELKTIFRRHLVEGLWRSEDTLYMDSELLLATRFYITKLEGFELHFETYPKHLETPVLLLKGGVEYTLILQRLMHHSCEPRQLWEWPKKLPLPSMPRESRSSL